MHALTIVSLSTPHTISQAALDCCAQVARAGGRILAQTAQSPCVAPLRILALPFESMDDLYIEAADFDALQSAMQARLLESCKTADTVYAVPGAGMGAALAPLLQAAADAGIAARVLPGVGYAQAALATLGRAYAGAYTAAANSLPESWLPELPLLIEELDTPLRAGEVKLYLQEFYPDEHPVQLFNMEESGAYTMRALPLYELDRQQGYHATTVLCVPPTTLLEQERYGYQELTAVMRRLRGPGGCPWDAEQTHESLKKTMIEECYEVLDAIDLQDDDGLCEELGDVLLQVVFHAAIAQEQGRFTGRDITTGIVKKLIFRHPHIFGTAKADTAGEVVVNWEKLKKQEKQFATQTDVLRAVPHNLPALMRAYKLQKKAAQVGFDWEKPEEALAKLEEETAELRRALAGDGDPSEEMGDILFSAVNVARLMGLEPEELLGAASNKFLARFAQMEALATQKGLKLENTPLKEQDALWNAIKSAQSGEN